MRNSDLDKYFSKNAQNRSFDFEEAYWSEMEALLDQEDHSKKGTFWLSWQKSLIGLAAIFVIGSGLWYAFSYHKNHKTTFTLHQKDNALLKNQNTQTPILKDKTTDDFSKNKTQNQNENNSSSENNTPFNNSISKTNNQQSSINQSYSIKQQTEKGTRNEARKETKKEAKKEILQTTKASKSSVTPTSNATQGEHKSDFSQKPIAVNTSQKEENQHQMEEWVYLTKLPMNALTSIQGILPTLDIKEDEDEDGPTGKSPTFPLSVGVIGGANFYNGLVNAGDQRANSGVKPFGGIYLATQPFSSKKIYTRIGLNYWERGSLNGIIQADSIVYGFGATIHSKTVNIYRAQYLEIPLTVAYQSTRGLITGGIHMNYMWNGEATLQEKITNPFESRTKAAVVQNGYQTAFRKLDVALSVGYERALFKHIFLGGKFQTGLLDITQNSIFKNTSIDRNTQFKAYIRYELKIN